MAFKNLVPATMNPVLTQGLGQAFQSTAVVDLAGAVIDLTAYTSLTAKASPPSPNPTGADVTFGTVTGGATGILTLATNATDLASVPTGSARLIISGKPTAGDIAQVLCTGTLSVNAG